MAASYDFPFEAAINALRAVVKTAYGISDSHPIPESGNPPIDVTAARLPMAALEAGGEVEFMDLDGGGQYGKSVLSIEEKLTFYCWLLQATTANANDLVTLRTKLRALKQALIADRTLGGTVTSLQLISTDWSGKGREWPFEIGEGGGLQAGYVGVRLVIEDE